MTAVSDAPVEGPNAEAEAPAPQIRDAVANAPAEVQNEEADAPGELESQESEPTAHFSLLTRLGAFPAVATLWDAASQSYGRAKSSSQLVATMLRLAECTAETVIVRGKPVVKKFSSQLSYVDGLACLGLDKVQQVYPDIAKKLPREMVGDAVQFGRRKYVDAKDYGFSKVQDVKSVSAATIHAVAHPVQTVSICKNHVLHVSCKVLEVADAALDRRMTQRGITVPGGPSACVAEAVAALQLLDSVVQKVQLCARVHLSARVATARQSAVEALAGLNRFVNGPLHSRGALGPLSWWHDQRDQHDHHFWANFSGAVTAGKVLFSTTDRFPLLRTVWQEVTANQRDRAALANSVR